MRLLRNGDYYLIQKICMKYEKYNNSLFQQKYNKSVQLEIEFNEDDNKDKPKSQFDQKLTKALNYNPKEDEKKDKGKNKKKKL